MEVRIGCTGGVRRNFRKREDEKCGLNGSWTIGEKNVEKMKKYNKENQKGVCLPAQLATFVLMVQYNA